MIDGRKIIGEENKKYLMQEKLGKGAGRKKRRGFMRDKENGEGKARKFLDMENIRPANENGEVTNLPYQWE